MSEEKTKTGDNARAILASLRREHCVHGGGRTDTLAVALEALCDAVDALRPGPPQLAPRCDRCSEAITTPGLCPECVGKPARASGGPACTVDSIAAVLKGTFKTATLGVPHGWTWTRNLANT